MTLYIVMNKKKTSKSTSTCSDFYFILFQNVLVHSSLVCDWSKCRNTSFNSPSISLSTQCNPYLHFPIVTYNPSSRSLYCIVMYILFIVFCPKNNLLLSNSLSEYKPNCFVPFFLLSILCYIT